MKKLLLTSAIILAAGAAQAAVAPYVSLKGGIADGGMNFYYTNGDPDNGYIDGYRNMSGFTGAFAGGIAYDVDTSMTLRAELEYTFSKTNGWNWGRFDMVNHTILLNGYADFGSKEWAIRPYVGAGFGYGLGNRLKWTDWAGNDWVNVGGGIAYAGMFGAAWAATDYLAFDLGFKYAVIDGVNSQDWWGGESSADLINRTVTLGARYSF
ncbi:MAG: outer membrane beta-barrel protein [Alphaproteobacteria bacterium]|nr:outer membrane beta-barrel protein [Alphaproteobacteria bacterium]